MEKTQNVLSGYDREPVAKTAPAIPTRQLPTFSVNVDTRISPFPLVTALSMAISEGLDELDIKAGVTIIKTGATSYCVKVEKSDI
jgi:hypothetical protein